MVDSARARARRGWRLRLMVCVDWRLTFAFAEIVETQESMKAVRIRQCR
jgi:hypothetical protein